MALLEAPAWTKVVVQIFGPEGEAIYSDDFVLGEITTAFETLLTVARTGGFDVETRFPAEGGLYVTSIMGITAEGKGGWLYCLETEDGRLFPSRPATMWTISEGTVVTWLWVDNPTA